MTASAIVAVILASSVLFYFTINAVLVYQDPSLITTERTKIWSEIIMTLVGGLLVYIAKAEK